MSTDVARKYGTTNPVLIAARVIHDPYDEFGWVQGWRFAICDRLVWDLGEYVSDFRSYGPDDDSYELECLREMDSGVEALRYALRILDRYREWLRIAGRDY